MLFCFSILLSWLSFCACAMDMGARSPSKGGPGTFQNHTIAARPSRRSNRVWCLQHCVDTVMEDSNCSGIGRRIARTKCFCSRESDLFDEVQACMLSTCKKSDMKTLRKIKKSRCWTRYVDIAYPCICDLHLPSRP